MLRKTRFVFCVSALMPVILLALSAPSRAQSSNGTLVGAVTDPANAAVPGAVVSVISAQYGIPRTATTDAVGTYRIESLQPGIYSVTFAASGFATLKVDGVNVQGSVTTTANGSLKIGSANATITVEAGAAQTIDTQSGSLGKSLGATEIQNLPYIDFNPADLALTLSGVQDVPSGQGAVDAAQYIEGLAFSVNGTRPHANNFLIDGQDDNDSSLSGQAYVPDNLGIISEVSVLENSYSAQYGFGGGSVTDYITKSGSNSYHGSLWEVNQNSAVASENAAAKFIAVPRKPFLNENTFGLELGGPVQQNKLFFYGTAQWSPTRQGAISAARAIPDANGIATLTTLAQTNVEAKYFLESLAGLVSPSRSPSIPCGAGTYDEVPGNGFPCIEMNKFARYDVREVGSNSISQGNWHFRLDYHPTENDQITGGYLHSYASLTPTVNMGSMTLQPFDWYGRGPNTIFRSHWAHTFSPSLLNEVRFSYTSLDFNFGFLPASLANPLSSLPYLVFEDSSVPSIGLSSEFPQSRGHKTYEWQEMLVKSSGTHTITAGVDFDRLDARDSVPLTTRGEIDYFPSQDGTIDAFGNFLSDFTGDGGSISKTTGNPVVNPNITLVAPYVQDTWRVKENLTLSAGLRYEFWGTPVNDLKYPTISPSLGIDASGAFHFGSVPLSGYPNFYATQEQPDRNNFAPRLGFAFTPRRGGRILGDGATVIRGGYGIFYDGLYTAVIDQGAEGPPNNLGATIDGGGGQGQGQALENLAALTPTQGPAALTFTVISNLRNPVTQQWNMDVQRELPGGFVLTASYVGTRGTKLFANQDWNPEVGFGSRINPNFGEVSVTTNAGQSWYNSGQLELEHQTGHGLTLRIAYTYSKFLDDASEVFITTGTTSYSQILNCQKCDWGPSAFDRRHRFVTSYVWSMPYAKGNWLTRALTNRWQWSGIATFETGTPNNVGDGYDNIGNGHPGSRPNLFNRNQPITHIGFDGGDGNFYSITTSCLTIGVCPIEPESYFRFIIPVIGPGNLGRNAVFGPGQIYFDTSIQRDFPLHFGHWESQDLMFRAEFFNAFNHPNLYTPDYTLAARDYDQVGATISGQRDIKFWLKYSF